MTTDSGFRQMAESIAFTNVAGSYQDRCAVRDLIETALAAAWAQGRDAVVRVAEAVIAANDKPNYNGSITRSVAGKIARRGRALTPAAVPSKENGE